MNLQNYIRDLSPELREKARKCETIDELIALAGDEKVELPEEVLEAIAGGKSQKHKNCGNPPCPKCGSDDVKVLKMEDHFSYFIYYFKCLSCGHKWSERID